MFQQRLHETIPPTQKLQSLQRKRWFNNWDVLQTFSALFYLTVAENNTLSVKLKWNTTTEQNIVQILAELKGLKS